MIPFSPPRVDQLTIDAVSEVLQSGWITTGPKKAEFERQIASYCNVEHVICLNSWTNAAELALRSFGIGPGDEVILPAYTYAATANIVRHVGATPVLVDCGDDYNIDPGLIFRHLSPRTKAIMPVDIGGLPSNYDAIRAQLEEVKFNPTNDRQASLNRPLLILDAAHSFGASYKGKSVAHYGDIVGFSFHAVKNLTTAEGGALVLNMGGEELKNWMSIMSLHGQTKSAMDKTNTGKWEYDIIEPGYKCNMTDIQAAMGLVELARYDETLTRRKDICDQYRRAFAGDKRFSVPVQSDENRESSYHLFMLRLESGTRVQRDQMIERIFELGVSTNVHFKPLTELTAYKSLGNRTNFPVAYDRFEKELSLPVYFDLSDENVAKVIDSVTQSANEILG